MPPQAGPPMGGQMPPGGAPPMMPQRPPMAAPQPGMPQGGPPPMQQPQPQQPPGMQSPQGLPQQGGPGLDWRMVLQKTIQANPGAPPQVLAAAVDRWLPLMNQQSAQQWKEQSLMLREQSALMREQQGEERLNQGWERLNQQRAMYGLPPLAPGGGGSAGGSQGQGGEQPKTGAQEIGDAIINGTQPPTLTGLYRQGPAVRTYLAEQKFDLAKAQQEWSRAQKLVLSLNGPQMVRFEGLAKSVVNTIDEVNSLAQRMELSGIPAANQLELMKYIQTEGNSPNGTLATKYVTAVGTLKEEFANLANGGYAPTEPAWALANRQINENYGVKQLGASLAEIQRLINYRVKAINDMGGTAGPGTANRYTGQQPGISATGEPTSASGWSTDSGASPSGQVQKRFQYDKDGNPVGQ